MNRQKELMDLNWNKHLKKVMNDLQPDQGWKSNSGLGLTLLAKIPEDLHQNIAKKIQVLKEKYPNQFFYPVDRIHLTVTGLIPVQENIKIRNGLLEKLTKLIKNTLQKHSAFEVEMNGLNITPTSVFIQGYYTSDTLDRLRADLISKIKAENLDFKLSHLSSFDLGYAWLTIMRFADHDVKNLMKEIKEMRNFEFGKFTVKEIHLVVTDKYFSEKNTNVIHSFSL